jgi:hypothetical protein
LPQPEWLFDPSPNCHCLIKTCCVIGRQCVGKREQQVGRGAGGATQDVQEGSY